MATTNSTGAVVLNYPDANMPVYAIAPNVGRDQVSILLDSKLDHLEAMMSVIAGEGAESFLRLKDDYQHNYLWACFNLVRETRLLWEVLYLKKVKDRHETADE